ncbi:MAG: hypothetical protein A2Z92_01930 [Omnitrophica WOR_2 bacterium GWA2_63_20]|nr:MAG: hypothetical protein A2Z92_01930 [Omnitrophica WOR_2 bacterium GWA2_63_20]HBQ38047.1 hypothetical protein [Candidatus Omnitrophota bacterium]
MGRLVRKLTHWTLRTCVPHRWVVRRGRTRLLHLGICLNSRISRFSPFLRIAGDEFVAEELGEALATHCPEIGSWQLYDVKEARTINADLVIVMWPDYPTIARRGTRTVLWLQNGGWAHRIPEFLKQFDPVFCASPHLCQHFPDLRYLPVTCTSRRLYHPVPEHPRFADEVAFIGNYSTAGRSGDHATHYMVPATAHRFAIWGSGWDHAEPSALRRFARGRLPVRLGPVVHSSCQIMLSYHSLPQRQDDMPSGRTFDALACGTFVLSDYMPSLEPLKPYVVFTTGGGDLREKLRYYLTHPEERKAKTQGARAWVLQGHTNAHRARELAKAIGLFWEA